MTISIGGLSSVPRNPLIADPLFLAGYVEKAGTGILDMIARCRAMGLPAPEFRQDGGQFVQVLRRPEAVATPQVTAQVEDSSKSFTDGALSEVAAVLGMSATQVTTQVATQVARILEAAEAVSSSREELQRAAGLSHREHFRKAYLEPLVGGEHLARLFHVRARVRLDLLPGEHRPRRGAPARVPHARGVIADDQDDFMAEVLELPELRKEDGVAEMDVRARRIEPGFDFKRSFR